MLSLDLGFECGTGDAALPNDRLQSSDSDFCMVWDGNRHCAEISLPLHHHVVSALPDHLETVLFENAEDFLSGEDAERTHAPLQSG